MPNPVADLYASIGLDTSLIDTGLRKVRTDFTMAAEDARHAAQIIRDSMSQVSSIQGTTLSQAGRIMEDYGRSVRGVAAAEEELGASVGRRMGMVDRMMTRMAFYAAIYGAARFAGASISRATDLQRQGQETGLGPEGAQRLQLAARETNTPVESMATAIAHMQRQVETMSLTTLTVFDRMGIKAVELRKTIEANPETGIKQLIDRINQLNSASERATAFQELFGTRSARDLEAISKLAEISGKATRLSEEEIKNVQRIKDSWSEALTAAQDYFAKAISLVPKFGDWLVGTPAENARRSAEFKAQMQVRGGQDVELPKESPIGFVGPIQGSRSRPEVPDSVTKALESIMRPLQPEGVRNILELQRQLKEAEMLERQGFLGGAAGGNRFDIKPGQFAQGGAPPLSPIQQIRAGYQDLINKEVLKEQRRELEETKGILGEFGVTGKATAQLLAIDFAKISQSFKEGKISLMELQEATSGYLEMITEKMAGPGFHRAVMMFSQGLLDSVGLSRALNLARSSQEISKLESQVLGGDDNSMALLIGAVRARQQQLFAPQERSNGTYLLAPSGSGSAPGIPNKVSSNDIGGSINIATLDQFSDMMVRRWKQQGLSTS